MRERCVRLPSLEQEPNLDSEVSPGEPIARFLRSSGQTRPGLGKASYSAFMPKLESGSISVFCARDLDFTALQELGQQNVWKSGPPLKGHALVPAVAFFDQGLALVVDGKPHPRHANAIGWETDAKNRIISKALAEVSALRLY